MRIRVALCVFMFAFCIVRGLHAQPASSLSDTTMQQRPIPASITPPQGWLVAATGTLENPDAVLPDTIQTRLDRARRSDDIVSVVGANERGAFYESWALDQAVASVETTSNEVVMTVRDERRLPMPVLLEAEYADGRTVERRVGVGPWLAGRRTVEVSLPSGTVTRVTLDPDQVLPDVDRSDNVWTAGDSDGFGTP